MIIKKKNTPKVDVKITKVMMIIPVWLRWKVSILECIPGPALKECWWHFHLEPPTQGCRACLYLCPESLNLFYLFSHLLFASGHMTCTGGSGNISFETRSTAEHKSVRVELPKGAERKNCTATHSRWSRWSHRLRLQNTWEIWNPTDRTLKRLNRRSPVEPPV